MKRINLKYILILVLTFGFLSCEDFLDKQPLSLATPEDYYQSAEQLQAAVNALYEGILPSHGTGTTGYGTFATDRNTDNQAYINADTKYAKGQWKVPMDESSNWNWENVRNINYILGEATRHYENGEISGDERSIKQYLGELYFLRAFSYFKLLQKFGDLPIIKEALPDNANTLTEASKRSPRNEVARFILSDLDLAKEYMSDNFDPNRNRLSPDVALLIKSRVALFEASWLENFKGTPFVPNGDGWPGKAKDYNANYEYPSGNIDKEIEWFYTQAAESAEIVADKYKNQLVQNTGEIPQSESDPTNPYFAMFGAPDMVNYPEVLQWREYSYSMGIFCSTEEHVTRGNDGSGPTRGLVEGFVMIDGKPIYAQHDGFTYNDQTLANVRQNADPRLHIFLKEPGQINLFLNMDSEADHGTEIEPYPNISGTGEAVSVTGYLLRKGGTFDKARTMNAKGYTNCITFRATEALLNYMEAEYQLTKSLNSGKTLEYWKAVRTAAGFTGTAIDPMTTINATDMSQEQLDWGAWTGGKLLTDAVLYNIRRERRCELMAEGLRWMDLCRWRSLDQMTTEPYHVEGIHLWNTPMEEWYDGLVYDGSSSSTVSNPDLSEYLRPFEKNMTSGNLFRDGWTWSLAQYLFPIPIKQLQLTSTDGASIDSSVMYQNPYWPTTADIPAEK